MLYRPEKDRRRKDYKRYAYLAFGLVLGYWGNDLSELCCTARAEDAKEISFSNFSKEAEPVSDDPLAEFDGQPKNIAPSTNSATTETQPRPPALPKIAVIEAPEEPEMITLFVPKSAIKRGEKITAALLTEKDFALAEINSDDMISREEMIGKMAKTYLRAGEPIAPEGLAAPILVKRNQKVRMIFEKSGLYIVTEGRALDNAGAGESVKVMNEAGKTVIFGTVTPEGEVKVGG